MSQDDSDRLDEIEDRLRSLEDNFLTLTTQLDTIIIIAKTCVAYYWPDSVSMPESWRGCDKYVLSPKITKVPKIL